MKVFKLALAFSTSLMMAGNAEARRGCCSHHRGVCSNQCCDGTALSAKCGGGTEVYLTEPEQTQPSIRAKKKNIKKIEEKIPEEKTEKAG